MLSVNQLSKEYGGRILFEDVSFQINHGERVGIIGPNGAGKSTLFSLILGTEDADMGAVRVEKNATVGFLKQESAPTGEDTILEMATNISPEMKTARKMMREFPDEDSEENIEAHAVFSENDGYQIEAKAKKILTGLAFRPEDLDKPATTMSGGWIMRAHLARLLIQEPDLLMLDEPTNHLDLESLGWFENYLKKYPGAILTISHDRDFLNAICDVTLEISRGKIYRYVGNYAKYLRLKKEREEQHLAAYKAQQREIKTLKTFAEKFGSKASKASQAKDKLKQIARMELIEAPQKAESTIKFHFPQPERSGQRVMTLEAVKQSYGDLTVYENLDLEVEREQRTVLVGPNGAGKSTLLKILADQVPIDAGLRKMGHKASIGYFSQHRTEMLDTKRTVLQEALDGASGVSEQMARTILGSFLFKGDTVFKSVSVLSGGEKSRLALVKLLLSPPNFLLLDEPTTHLDIASIDALIGALKNYSGTLFFVSHDVHFIRALATTVLHVHSGKITPYAGNYDYFLEKSQVGTGKQALTAALSNHQPQTKSTPSKDPKKTLKEIRLEKKAQEQKERDRARKRKNLEKRITEIEEQMQEQEALQKKLAQELSKPETNQDPEKFQATTQQLTTIAQKINQLIRDWDDASDALGKIEKG